MAENMSLADQAVQALAMVKAMDASIENTDPHRHIVRGLKRMAEARLSQAFREAQEIAYMAQDLPALVDGVRLRTMKELADMQPAEDAGRA
jgi:hypothetical protein